MKRRHIIIILGLLIALMPHLGFSMHTETTFYTTSGILVALLAFSPSIRRGFELYAHREYEEKNEAQQARGPRTHRRQEGTRETASEQEPALRGRDNDAHAE